MGPRADGTAANFCVYPRSAAEERIGYTTSMLKLLVVAPLASREP